MLLQIAFGWQTYHLYEFEIGGEQYALPHPDDSRPDIRNAKAVNLDQLELKQGDRFTYTYDLGDDWLHSIAVEGTTPIPPGMRFPLLLGGARACPPEDAGGPHGYQRYLEALKRPKTREGREALEWRGPFDSEHWDPRPILRLFAPSSPRRANGRMR